MLVLLINRTVAQVCVAQVSAAERYVLVLLSNGTVLSFGDCHDRQHISGGGRGGRGEKLKVNYTHASIISGVCVCVCVVCVCAVCVC